MASKKIEATAPRKNSGKELVWPSQSKQPKNPQGTRDTRDFFNWVYANGDAQAKALDYVPLPDSLVKQIEGYWAQNIK